MASGFPNQAKILRGAFVEYGLSLPPLFVVFQFNPLTITRTRSATSTNSEKRRELLKSSFVGGVANDPGGMFKDFRAGQTLSVKDETIGFDIRLDATDKLNWGDAITEQFGIAPQLSTLELMITPKNQSVMGGLATLLLGGAKGSFAFSAKTRIRQ